MKKLMALLVVAGMVFVACNNKPKEEEPVAEEAVQTEQTAPAQPEAAPATTEEAPAQPEAAPAN